MSVTISSELISRCECNNHPDLDQARHLRPLRLRGSLWEVEITLGNEKP